MFLSLQDHHWLIGLINCLLYPPALLEITELFVRNFTLSFIHYYYYFFFVRQELKKKKRRRRPLEVPVKKSQRESTKIGGLVLKTHTVWLAFCAMHLLVTCIDKSFGWEMRFMPESDMNKLKCKWLWVISCNRKRIHYIETE